jgi:Leucine-rich repeat (LRR) protein
MKPQETALSAKEVFSKKNQIPSEVSKSKLLKQYRPLSEPTSSLAEEVEQLTSFLKKEGSQLYLNDPTKFKLKSLSFLSDVPDGLIKLLDLSNNPLIRFNLEPGWGLSKLKHLSLEKCGLVEFSAKNIPQLAYLDLSNNRLQMIPDLTGLAELENVNLSGNSLTSILLIDSTGFLKLN